MQPIFFKTEICATLYNENHRDGILPTLNTITFIFSKDVLALINKHCIISCEILVHSSIGSEEIFKCFSLVKQLETGY